MLKKKMQAMRRRVGPVGLSLVAAAVTAIAFAGVTMAADGGGGKADESGESGAREGFSFRAGPGPALSEEDQQKLEEFRSCLEENGAPTLPDPGEMRERFRNGERPDPPSKEERKQMREAFEACKDKLPEGAELGVGPGGCGGPGHGGPPPGMPEGTAIPAPPSGGSQGDVEPAPQGSTS